MKTVLLFAICLIAASPAFADTLECAAMPDNYTLMWKETVQKNLRLRSQRGFTKQSCEDAASKLTEMSAFCELSPHETPLIKSDEKEPNHKEESN